MYISCPVCGALHWIDGRVTSSSKKRPQFAKCCRRGKVTLPTLRVPPEELMELLDGDIAKSRFFREHIQEYNASNDFTSLGCKLDTRDFKGKDLHCSSIHGEIRHRSGSLLPQERQDPIYSQLYVYDPNLALAFRAKRNPRLDKDILKIIQDTLLEHNVFCTKYHRAHDILSKIGPAEQTVKVIMHYKETTDERRYNLPISYKVSVILPGDGSEMPRFRDIILHLKA
ncbi:hypothetical protein MKX01_006286, partial [Papaver californicum]